MTDKTPKEIAETVASMLNGMGPNHSKEFIASMANQHRTLQQLFTRLCFMWLEECDKMHKSGRYDGRNEASVRISKKLYDHMEKEEISFNRKYLLPFI